MSRMLRSIGAIGMLTMIVAVPWASDLAGIEGSPKIEEALSVGGSEGSKITPHADDSSARPVRKRAKELWRFEATSQVSQGPFIADGTVLAATWDGEVYTLDLQTGKERWRYTTSGIVISPPVVYNAVVYFVGLDGGYGSGGNTRLYALDLRSGMELWSFQTEAQLGHPPVIHEEALYVSTTSKTVVAVDRATGKMLWQFTTPSAPVTAPLVSKNTVMVGNFDGNIYGVNIRTGEKRWHVGRYYALEKEGLPNSPLTFGAIRDNSVYFRARKLVEGLFIYGVDVDSGAVTLRVPTQGPLGKSPVAGRSSLFSMDGRRLVALEIPNGKHLWSLDLEGQAREDATLHLVNNILYVLGEYLLSVDIHMGNVRWKSSSTNPRLLSITDEIVCFSSFDHIYGLDRQTGLPQWLVPMEEYLVNSSQIAYSDGVLVYNDARGHGRRTVFGARLLNASARRP